MTTTTIIQIILALFFVSILRKYYFSIIKKIDIDIEKQKWGKTESNLSNNEDYWEKKHLEEQKDLIDKIEKLKKTCEEEAKIHQQEGDMRMRAEYKSGSSESRKETILFMNSHINNTLYEDGMLPKTLTIYNYLLDLAKTNKNTWVLEKILDIIILHKEEGNIEKSHKNWMSEQKDNIKMFQQELEQKQQELELREAKIIKIESAQKILNSELVEKINKEIILDREDFLQFVKNNPNKN
jgi:hypothetical protein